MFPENQYLHQRDGKPCSPTGEVVNGLDPRNWMSREDAIAVAERTGYGLAFALTREDPWFLIDLDKCIDNGIPNEAALEILRLFPGACAEVSRSGTGYHIVGWCDKARLLDKRRKWDGWKEFYTHSRLVFFGQGFFRIGGIQRDSDWTAVLEAFVPDRVVGQGELPEGADPAYTGPEDDDELIRLMLSSRGGTASQFGERASLADLWHGNAETLSGFFPAFKDDGFDHSSADAALMSHLAFWCGKDMARMDRVFRKSALMRDKWEKREDYRQSTIENAVSLCQNVYSYERGGGTGDDDDQYDEYLSASEMERYFKGCVYVRNQHKVLTPDGEILKPEQFNATYGGRMFQMFADNTRPTRKAFEAFTESAVFRPAWAKSVRFAPGEPFGAIDERQRVNTYREPEIREEPGDVRRLTDFLERLLPDANDRAIITAYCAAVVQYPGVKFQWAPVLQGAEGNGKTLIASCVKYAVGESYVHEPRASQLAEKFNSYIEGKVLVICEEFHMNDRREMLDELKPLITNTRIEVRPMNQEKRMIDNLANWFFCTNHRDAVIKSRNDRRYAVFFTAQQSFDDIVQAGMGGSYFPDLYDWLRECGYAYMAHWLRTYPIPPELNPAMGCHRAPVTSSQSEVFAASMGPIEQEIREALESQLPGFRQGWISSHALDRVLEDRRLRTSRHKLSGIVRDMGFNEWGKAPRPLIQEGMKRPKLWYSGEVSERTFDDYLEAQGYE